MGAQVIISETMDGGGNLATQCGVEDFVEAVKKDAARIFTQPGIELCLVKIQRTLAPSCR